MMTSYSKTNPIPLDKLKALKPQFEPLRPILDAGWPTIPLHEPCATKQHKGKTVRLGKAPIDSNWPRRKAQTKDQAITNAIGNNTGIPLGRNIGDYYLCAYDIDSGNLPNGLKDIPPLIKAIAKQLDVLLDELVIHQSGNDGLHVFFLSSEADLRGRIEIGGIKVELKSLGHQVVAPGSVHPDTGRLYQVHPDSADHGLCPIAPQRLIAEFSKPSVTSLGIRTWPPSRLDWIAEQIVDAEPDPLEDYEDWLKAGMGFHAASGGEDYGLDAWIACSWTDAEEACCAKWLGFRHEGGITEKTLTHYLEAAGAKPGDAPNMTEGELAEYVADDFADLTDDEVAKPKLKKPAKKLYSLGELINLPEPEWLVDHAIPRNGLVVLYGPPKSAKTFLALDMALSIGSNQKQMHGIGVKPGKVLYVLAEGGASMMGNRARAWMKVKGVDEADLKVFPFGITLSSRKSVDELLELAGTEWDLVVVDTLARCMDGDENSAKDMALAIKGSDYIREMTGAAVLLVHHSGKDQTKGLRGSTALLGAVDATIKMRSHGNTGGFALSVPELRHGEPPEPQWLRLQSTGDSAVLVSGAAPSTSNPNRKLSDEDLLRHVAATVLEGGTPRTAVAEELMTEFDVSEATVKRGITRVIPKGKDKAIKFDEMLIWREANTTGDGPRAEIVRVRSVAE